MSVVLLSQLGFTGCSGEFHVALEHFEDIKYLILNVLKENSLASWDLLTLKS